VSLVAPLVLILAKLGSILGGLATASEAAGMGALGAIMLAARRTGGRGGAWPIDLAFAAFVLLLFLAAVFDLRLGGLTIGLGAWIPRAVALLATALVVVGIAAAILRLLRSGMLADCVQATARVTAMIFGIVVGASLFSLVFIALGGERLVRDVLVDLPGGSFGAVAIVMAVMFVLGFFLDFLEIVFVVVPIVAPVLLKMPGVDPVWLGVMMCVNFQTSFLTPPMAPTLFYLRAVAPPSVRSADMYRGVMPYLLIQVAMLGILWVVPGLATWLPHALFGR
jgi:TRAP-type mannitol/chloroaromatic compound transport system permease large subunit